MKLLIPPGEFGAFIFDLDGTLLDTMPLHHRAWDGVLRAAGLPQGMEFYGLAGATAQEFIAGLTRHYGRNLSAPALLWAKDELFAALLPEATVIEATVEFARSVEPGRPLAVASGGPRAVVLASLAASGLKPLFPTVVTGDDVRRGKPAPDLFLLAALRMDAPPAACLVFEDSEPGLRAAEAAGMRWVRVPANERPSRQPRR